MFQFEDCIPGNKSKAATAAEALRKIYPSVNANYMEMKIPMPGHPVSEKGNFEKIDDDSLELKEVEETVNRLDELIQSHDIIFLVMDSRESR